MMLAYTCTPADNEHEMRTPTHRLLTTTATLFALLLTAPVAGAAPRVLRAGATGASVAALQTLLADAGYLPWTAVGGAYDYRTTQAVMAFEGWSRITRDGVARRAVLRRLGDARRPRPWTRYHGRRIEVHVDRQVALLVDAHNHVVRAIHVSTGASGKTPLGDFTIFRKELNSFSYAFKVILPFASYFNAGFAFHQYPDVPGYPASHGCVRVPQPEAPVVWAFATYGTAVHIHP
jgi:peptidoglycan hydrolase-like protein with peptidoglycan-binding domain